MSKIEIGGYWTAIDKKNGGGWILRDQHATIGNAVEYAEKMNMLAEGRVVIMQEVAEIHYIALGGE